MRSIGTAGPLRPSSKYCFHQSQSPCRYVDKGAQAMHVLRITNTTYRETDMSKNFQQCMIHGLAIAALVAAAATSADAAVWVRSRVVVRPVVAVPVVAAPVVAAPVAVAPVLAAPVVAAPVVVVPVCSVVSVPVVNALNGVTYMVPRRVCN
jgi:hypothetical protein